MHLRGRRKRETAGVYGRLVAAHQVSQGWAFDIHSKNATCEGHENVVCDNNKTQPGDAGFSNVPTVSCPATKP